MSRLLPLMFVALLPVAVAAPVPRDVRPDFGTGGLLTRADLDTVRFDSRPVKDDEKFAGEKRKGGEPKFDLAVHLPWTTFREGEPVPAYFVLRNNADSVLELHSCLDFSEPFPAVHGGECDFDVRDRATGESVRRSISHVTNCGGGSFTDVPARGYFVFKGDVSRVGEGTLPPGEYEVDWRYRRLYSAPVRFTVEKTANPKPAPRERRSSTFYHLTGSSAAPERPGEPVEWRCCSLGYEYPLRLAGALGVGQLGVYVPDLQAIPTADKHVEAWVEWKPYRAGDRVAVTLRARPPFKEVHFAELPQLYLQIDAAAEWSVGAPGEAKDSARRGEALVTPLTIEARLPAGWREAVGVDGTARVAVVVVSRRLKLPSPGGQVKQVEEIQRTEKRVGPEPPPEWSGVVRTDFVELNFPPRRAVYLQEVPPELN